MSATDSLARLVSLVAELTLRERSGAPALSLDELAASFSVSRAQIARDLLTLGRLGDQSDDDWLLSLRVWQQGDKVSVSSQGPFRRPIRLNANEMLALQVALVSVGELDLAARLGGGGAATAAGSARENPPMLAATSAAVAGRRRLRCRYAGDGAGPRPERTIQPHQVIEYRNRTYVVAWCEETGDWRRFRLDRFLWLEEGAAFEPRADFAPISSADEVFRAGSVEEVTVRYRGGAARWARERYPRTESQPDGSVLVRFSVANPEWLVRSVLEIGSDAEVVEPIEYRRRLRDAVA